MKILCVVGNQDRYRRIGDAAEIEGAEVDRVETGLEAMDKLRKGEYDGILLQTVIPAGSDDLRSEYNPSFFNRHGIVGLEVLARLREMWRDDRVVLLDGFGIEQKSYFNVVEEDPNVIYLDMPCRLVECLEALGVR